MAKYGYTCQCGWQLKRANLTRREYAAAKEQHAFQTISRPRIIEFIDTTFGQEMPNGCHALRKELQESRKASQK